MTDLHSVDKRRAMLEQAIRETTGGSATVKRCTSCYWHLEMFNRGLQLITTPTGVAMHASHTYYGITRHLHTGLIDALLIDQYLSGHNPAPRFFLAVKDAALN